MPSRLQNLPPPNLIDDDLKALGLVAAYSAHAEHSLGLLLTLLLTLSSDKALKRPRLLGQKLDLVKDLLKSVAGTYPVHAEIGRQLMEAGHHLADDRTNIMHMPASRNSEGSGEPITFAHLAKGQPKVRKWSRKKVLAVAADYAEWWIDINQLLMRIVLGGLLPSHTTVHGPALQLAPLTPDVFRTLQNPRFANRRSAKGK